MDNRNERNQPDADRINMNQDYEVKYWTKALGVDRKALKKAVDEVGPSAARVKAHFATSQTRH